MDKFHLRKGNHCTCGCYTAFLTCERECWLGKYINFKGSNLLKFRGKLVYRFFDQRRNVNPTR